MLKICTLYCIVLFNLYIFAMKSTKHYKYMNIDNTKAQMRKGILELCILATISQKPQYSSEILTQLKAAKLLVVEGTLYPLLTRLKNAELLEYHWEESNSGPPRKYFKITAKGKETLKELTLSWENLSNAVQEILD